MKFPSPMTWGGGDGRGHPNHPKKYFYIDIGNTRERPSKDTRQSQKGVSLEFIGVFVIYLNNPLDSIGTYREA